MRSRSTSAAAAVQVRVRAIACRSRREGDTPAAAALACQAACSADVTRAATMTVRRSAISAPGGQSGGRGRLLSREPDLGARRWGFEGGRRSPSPEAQCSTLSMLAPDVHASGASPFRDPRAAFGFRCEAPPPCWIGVGLLAWIAVALVYPAEVGSVSSTRVALLSWAR